MDSSKPLRSKHDMCLADGRRFSDVYSLDYENEVLSDIHMVDTEEYKRIKDELVKNYDSYSHFLTFDIEFEVNPIILKWWKYFGLIN